MSANLYQLSEDERRRLGVNVLPATLKEALEEWESDDICRRVLGSDNAQRYEELKLQEWKEYESHVSSNVKDVTEWEIGRYLYA